MEWILFCQVLGIVVIVWFLVDALIQRGIDRFKDHDSEGS